MVVGEEFVFYEAYEEVGVARSHFGHVTKEAYSDPNSNIMSNMKTTFCNFLLKKMN